MNMRIKAKITSDVLVTLVIFTGFSFCLRTTKRVKAKQNIFFDVMQKWCVDTNKTINSSAFKSSIFILVLNKTEKMALLCFFFIYIYKYPIIL